jgi:hypothetical protein
MKPSEYCDSQNESVPGNFKPRDFSALLISVPSSTIQVFPKRKPKMINCVFSIVTATKRVDQMTTAPLTMTFPLNTTALSRGLKRRAPFVCHQTADAEIENLTLFTSRDL